MTKHSVFSASAADRWSACPGSVILSRGKPDRTGAAALEGSIGHALVEKCLLDGTDPLDHPLQVEYQGKLHDVKEDLLSAAQSCVDYVRSFNVPFAVEIRAVYADLLGLDDDEAFGTLDIALLVGRTLHIIDHKFGRRWVDPVKNRQLTLYGAPVAYGLRQAGVEVDEVVLHISQPRLFDTPQTHSYTYDELMDVVGDLHVAAQRVVEADAAFVSEDDIVWQDAYLVPGEVQCMYCRAAASCPKLLQEVDAVMPDQSTADPDEFPTLLKYADSKELAENHSKIPLLNIWIAAVEHEVNSRLSEGQAVPGKKMVLGRQGHRHWADKEKAKAFAAELGVPTSGYLSEPDVRSPAQIEAAIKKLKLPKDKRAEVAEAIEKLTVRNAAKPTVVDEDHPGEPWVPVASVDEFESLA